jgi:hypothetical protein
VFAVAIGPDGGDHRNEVAVLQDIQHFPVDLLDAAHLTHVQHLAVDGAFLQQLLRLNEIAVLACNADGLALILVEQADDLLVHQAAQHHLHNIHGLAVCDTDAVNELRLDVQLGQQRTNLRTAAVHYHGVHAHQLHEHDVARKAVLEHFISHGIAAVLHDNRASGKFLDVGQELR